MSAPALRAPQPASEADQDRDHADGRYLLDRPGLLGPLLLLPAVIYIVALVGFPLMLALLYSLSDVTTGDQSLDFVGLRNFTNAWNDSRFRSALGNTIRFTLISQVAVLILANVLALILSADFKGKRLVRFLVLLPWTTPVALAVVGWLWLLDSVYSPIDWTLRQIGLLGPGTAFGPAPNMYWLADPARAQIAIILVHVWRMLPFATVILLAGLTAIPQDVREAARVDGAGFWRQLFWIRLPLLLPIMAVAVLFSMVFTITDITVVHILTRGNANTQVLTTWAYFRGIEGGNLAQGAAIALFLFPALVGIAILMLRVARRSEIT